MPSKREQAKLRKQKSRRGQTHGQHAESNETARLGMQTTRAKERARKAASWQSNAICCTRALKTQAEKEEEIDRRNEVGVIFCMFCCPACSKGGQYGKHKKDCIECSSILEHYLRPHGLELPEIPKDKLASEGKLVVCSSCQQSKENSFHPCDACQKEFCTDCAKKKIKWCSKGHHDQPKESDDACDFICDDCDHDPTKPVQWCAKGLSLRSISSCMACDHCDRRSAPRFTIVTIETEEPANSPMDVDIILSSPPLVCSVCHFAEESSKLKKCSRCKVKLYCSKRCQMLDWDAGHKKSCR